MTSEFSQPFPSPSRPADPGGSAPRTADERRGQGSHCDDGAAVPQDTRSDRGIGSPGNSQGDLGADDRSSKTSASQTRWDRVQRTDAGLVRPAKTRGPRFEALESAIEQLQVIDPTFTGTMYAISKRMRGVGHQRVVNLITGQTRPWAISAHMMFELLRVFRECGSLKASDFMMPKEETWRK